MPMRLSGKLRKEEVMENDCANRCIEWCRLTAHCHEGDMIVYTCAYPHNCKECKDYKPRNLRDDPRKFVSVSETPDLAPSGA